MASASRRGAPLRSMDRRRETAPPFAHPDHDQHRVHREQQHREVQPPGEIQVQARRVDDEPPMPVLVDLCARPGRSRIRSPRSPWNPRKATRRGKAAQEVRAHQRQRRRPPPSPKALRAAGQRDSPEPPALPPSATASIRKRAMAA